jgi:hypothetical protein
MVAIIQHFPVCPTLELATIPSVHKISEKRIVFYSTAFNFAFSFISSRSCKAFQS